MNLNALFLKRTVFHKLFRHCCSKKVVLGIETSCDDTAAAVIDETGKILGHKCESQMKIHLENGGVIPHIAVHFHRENIESVVSSSLAKSGLSLENISAVAVTTKPGLRGSLLVGLQHAKKVAKAFSKPLIPIHHMEAHALTPRLNNEIPFPFLALLASGGHCQIALVNSVDEFLLLGNSCHNSPGEVLDKIARRLKLQNLPSCRGLSGGHAIEVMSEGGDPTAYSFPHSLLHYRDCNFSFSGFTSTQVIEDEEKRYDVAADGVIPNVRDFCASLLHGYSLHLSHRVERAFEFCKIENLMSDQHRALVFSGGVACNSYIRKYLQQMCTQLNSKFFPAPKHLCNDNGIMIAWNGIEKLRKNIDILYNFDDVLPDPDCPLGIDMTETVRKANIKVRLPRINVSAG
ncbi:tRNA N6-adenosine threonylcarbamoyltransferase, mitochondrial [Parasteatoda tepidariorum]|uniref:tRNA N6-adenosine threonylcarbamoyltransferase, mitochondrial n=1 Tax=Parasteatoda tepidariorum TaxID=114398 RepID=UPI001C7184E8|nr:probable tRNA N6-adenosine threonylcarbamoyltransferase, mitochondrial [Parasteatoda tepidariorum]